MDLSCRFKRSDWKQKDLTSSFDSFDHFHLEPKHGSSLFDRSCVEAAFRSSGLKQSELESMYVSSCLKTVACGVKICKPLRQTKVWELSFNRTCLEPEYRSCCIEQSHF